MCRYFCLGCGSVPVGTKIVVQVEAFLANISSLVERRSCRCKTWLPSLPEKDVVHLLARWALAVAHPLVVWPAVDHCISTLDDWKTLSAKHFQRYRSKKLSKVTVYKPLQKNCFFIFTHNAMSDVGWSRSLSRDSAALIFAKVKKLTPTPTRSLSRWKFIDFDPTSQPWFPGYSRE